jgi:membrane protein
LSLSGIIRFLTQDLWRIRLGDLSGKKSFIIKQLRIIVLAFRGFDEDKCILRASALTLYSLLNVVSLFALAFGISKGFGLQGRLENELKDLLKGQEEVVNYIIQFANSMLEKAKGGPIAGIGIIVLVWFLIKLLMNIEQSFNDIWGVTHSRSIGRKLSDYLSFLFVAPILIILSSSTIVFIKTKITLITETVDLLGPISPLILFSLKLLPYCAIWLLFTFIYIFMPNTRVKLKSGLLGGITAGTIFVIVQWIYITFQVGIARYGAIYVSFAALPFFMFWIQASWLVVLFGAEITFAHQNVDTYEFETDSLIASNETKRLLALRIANLCVKNFINGEEPWDAGRIATFLEIPIRLTNRLLDDLVKAHVLSEAIGDDEKTTLYQPAKDVNILTINYVIQQLDGIGSNEMAQKDSEEIKKISESFDEFNRIIDNSKANMLLKDI